MVNSSMYDLSNEEIRKREFMFFDELDNIEENILFL